MSDENDPVSVFGVDSVSDKDDPASALGADNVSDEDDRREKVKHQLSGVGGCSSICVGLFW